MSVKPSEITEAIIIAIKNGHAAPATPTQPNRQAQTGVAQGTPQPTTPPSPAAINNTKQIPAATGTTRVSHSTDQHIAAQGDKISRPSWRDSEIEIGKDYPNYEAQRSFLNGKEVPYGTKESVRPEYYHNGIKNSIEVKNYNIETSAGRNRLINNISIQVKQRVMHLPEGTKQTVVIDIRGQNISSSSLREIRNRIIENSGSNVEVLFKQ